MSKDEDRDDEFWIRYEEQKQEDLLLAGIMTILAFALVGVWTVFGWLV